MMSYLIVILFVFWPIIEILFKFTLCIPTKISRNYYERFSGLSQNYSMKLIIQNQRLEWSNHAKYLGVTLNYNLSFEKHIKTTFRKARVTRAALYPVLNKNSAVPISARLTIYKIYLRPIILYAAPIWRHLIGQRTWTKIEYCSH